MPAIAQVPAVAMHAALQLAPAAIPAEFGRTPPPKFYFKVYK